MSNLRELFHTETGLKAEISNYHNPQYVIWLETKLNEKLKTVSQDVSCETLERRVALIESTLFRSGASKPEKCVHFDTCTSFTGVKDGCFNGTKACYVTIQEY